jgi:hypothetical protein
MARLLVESVVATLLACAAAIVVLGWIAGPEGSVGGGGKVAAIEQGIAASVAFGIVFLAIAFVLRIRELPLVATSMVRALRGRAA